jgi:hypothetical protein
MGGYIIQQDTPIWTSPSRTRLAVGRLTRSHSSRRGSSLLHLPLRLRLLLRLHRKLHLPLHLDRKLRLHLPLHRKLRLHLLLHLELEAKRISPGLPTRLRTSSGVAGRGSGYSNKRSSESRQICDHVSMVSRRVNNSSFARNVRPVIIASRFSTLGSASLNT